MLKVAKAALADVATAFRIVAGEVPVPVVAGMSDAEVRLKLAADVLNGVGVTLSAAVEVAGRAEAMMSLMVAPEPALVGPVEVEEVEEVEEREPFGFAAYFHRKERAAKAA